jgi:hypothetical protein
MKKISVLIALVVLSLSVVAVSAATPVDDKAERVRLSKDLHDIRNIRERINGIISSAADTIPPADREDFQKYVQLKVDYDALEAKSIAYAADIYTVPELKAMIAYFGSPDGQSAESKGAAFSDKISKDIIKQVDAAILAAKYDGVPEDHLPKIAPKTP